MTAEAKQRLAVLQRFTELGAGFQIATHDLEIRGAGELLGERQHGRDRRGRLRHLRAHPRGGGRRAARRADRARARSRDLGRRAGVPPRRLRARHRPAARALPAAGAGARRGRRARDAGRDADRYGPLPDEVVLLGEVMVDKTVAAPAGRARLRAGSDAPRADLRARRRRCRRRKVMELVQAKGSRWKLTPDMRLAYSFDDREKKDRMAAARAPAGEVEGRAA